MANTTKKLRRALPLLVLCLGACDDGLDFGFVPEAKTVPLSPPPAVALSVVSATEVPELCAKTRSTLKLDSRTPGEISPVGSGCLREGKVCGCVAQYTWRPEVAGPGTYEICAQRESEPKKSSCFRLTVTR